MRNCDLGYEHDDPEPVIVEDSGQAEAVEAAGEANVEIARIEGDTAVQIAKIESRGRDAEIEAAFAAMQARIDVLEAAAAPPEPEVVPVPVAAPEPAPEPVPAPEETEPKAERKSPAKRGFFG